MRRWVGGLGWVEWTLTRLCDVVISAAEEASGGVVGQAPGGLGVRQWQHQEEEEDEEIGQQTPAGVLWWLSSSHPWCCGWVDECDELGHAGM